MHEFSIATALLELVKQHAPAGTTVRKVVMEAGPLQSVDPQAMEWAWQAVSDGTMYAGAELEVRVLPWRLRCRDCGREHVADDMLSPCPCGCQVCHPTGGDELRLVSLTVDEP